MKELKLEDDRMCFACGERNSDGLGLKFEMEDRNTLTTQFTFAKKHQGFKDIVHGGLIALIFDELIVNLGWKLGYKAIGAELSVRFKKPAKVGEVIKFKAMVEKDTAKVLYARAIALSKDGSVIAQATGKAVKI